MTARNKIYVVILRVIHAAFAAYFIACIGCIYYSVFTLQVNVLLWLAIGSLFLEGFFVFVLNHGHCPLAPIQKKLNDPVPFFNLFLPDHLAKKAIPFFTSITFLGILVLIIRLLITG